MLATFVIVGSIVAAFIVISLVLGSTSSASVSTQGLLVYLDAGNPDSQNGSGTTWYDLTTHHNDATLVNTPTYQTQQFSFDDASFQQAVIEDLGTLQPWTIESWFRLTGSLTNHATAVVTNLYDLSSNVNFAMRIDEEQISGSFQKAPLWYQTEPFSLQNNWTFMSVTYDGSSLRTQVNGSLQGTLSSNIQTESGGEIRIARRWDSAPNVSTNFFPGDISIVRVYNVALSANQVSQNYNAQKNRFS